MQIAVNRSLLLSPRASEPEPRKPESRKPEPRKPGPRKPKSREPEPTEPGPPCFRILLIGYIANEEHGTQKNKQKKNALD